MTKAICTKCQAEYEKKSELDSIFCQLCQMRSNVRVYEVVSATFLTFGLMCIGMFLPLAIIPLVIGANSLGYYVPFGKGGMRATPFAFLMMNLVNAGLMIAFLSVWKYFKGKLNKMKIRLSEIENKDTQYFGRRWIK